MLFLLSLIFCFFGLIDDQNLLKIVLIFTLQFKSIRWIFILGQIIDPSAGSVIQFVFLGFRPCGKRGGLVIIGFFRVNLFDL